MISTLKRKVQRKLFKPSGRFSHPFFKDARLQRDVAYQGWAVERGFLSPDEVAKLDKDARQLISMVGDDINDRFWPSGRSSDPKIRNFARESIDSIVPKRLEQYFDPNVADIMAGTYLIKPTGETSNLSPHQDSAHVDEEKFFAVYAWIPLCDVSPENGTLHVLPGSQNFGNRQRSLNVPWQFEGLQANMHPFLEPLHLKAGDVVFFEEATIHYSSDNLSDDYRIALNYFVRPKACPFTHYFIDKDTPEGKVEAFEVDMDFFYNEDFESRPSDKYRFLGYVDHTAFDCSPDEFDALCRKHLV